MFRFSLELTLEEQAMMVLWERIRPLIHESNHEKVLQAIQAVFDEYLACQNLQELKDRE